MKQNAQPAAHASAPVNVAPATAGAPASPDLPPAPDGNGWIINRDGNHTVITPGALPPDVMITMRRAEETAFGLMGLLAAIIILGPFARMIARRMEKRPEINATIASNQLLQQQILQLQQSIDTMSIEVERISEGQRFQSKLLNDKRGS
jgi:hypothetical protein